MNRIQVLVNELKNRVINAGCHGETVELKTDQLHAWLTDIEKAAGEQGPMACPEQGEVPTQTDKQILAIVTPAWVRRIRKCVETIEYYGKFSAGQDGFQAVTELRQFVDALAGTLSPYGICPHCSKPGVSRERRPNGNDTCESGHVYPSTAAR